MKMGSPLPHRKARIEIIPLIDIMFFLLASFMMVSLSMIHMQAIKVNLPTATKANPETKPDIVNIAVDKKGDMYLEKTPIKANDLVVELLKKYRANTNIPVYISGDRDASHGSVINVLDLVRKAGIQKVAFAINKADDSK
jgi:biopolymer transport protein ExbD